jgi:type 1 glutamine amidotransferase
MTGRIVLAPATKSKTISVKQAQSLAAKIAKDKGLSGSIKGKYATEHPSSKSDGSYRSAVSGRFVTSSYGKRNPATTVKERESQKG